jgi:4-alpha-glucanotransferase
LAQAHGVQLSYTANDGRRVRASNDALVATLGALGVPAGGRTEISEQLEMVRQRGGAELLEPVVVLGRAGQLSAPVVLPAAADPADCHVTVTAEGGTASRRSLADLITSAARPSPDGPSRPVEVNLAGLRLSPGYHELAIEADGTRSTALLLAPPMRRAPRCHDFGVFAPIYSLRSDTDWGSGSFTELARLTAFVGARGGATVGTLPMYPAFFEPPVDPSPYLPVSRLFLNEAFIDVEALPEFASAERPRRLAASAETRRGIEDLRRLPRVDYAEVMRLKRPVLEACAAELWHSPARKQAFDAHLSSHPELSSYAAFRAVGERLGGRWRSWGTRAGELPAGAVDPAAERYHLYVQFAAAEQLAAVAAGSSGAAGLYLDLPVGVHPDGFDTWSQPELFAAATVGAPPDRLAPQGQAWGFPPLHPQAIRRDRYRYLIACFRHLFGQAEAVRIDHVLGLQRLFWIPRGASAEAGAYVRYRSEELFAVLALEADRAGAVVIGEDLGTVSEEVRRAMDRNGLLHTFVYQFEASARDPFPQPHSPSLAAFGSHDLPRFATFWTGADIDERAGGAGAAAARAEEHADREALVKAVEQPLTDRSTGAAYAACIDALAAGPAEYVMVDLADIEGETEPDNRPGTGPEAENWRWRLSRPLEAILGDPSVTDLLDVVAGNRRSTDREGVSA